MLQPLRKWTGIEPQGPQRYIYALLSVALATGVSEVLYRNLGVNRVSMIFVLSVLLVAVSLGSGPAYLTAGLALFAYNFFLTEPRFEFIFEAEDAIVLVVFLFVAMLTGGLAGRVRDEARRADARARASGALFQATRDFSSADDPDTIRAGLAAHIAQASRREAVIWHDGRQWRAPAEAPIEGGLLTQLADIAARPVSGEPVTVALGAWQARPLRATSEGLGVAAWRADSDRASEEAQRLINVLIDVGAAAIARANLAEARAERDILARTERLRAALLSSISHDLRTPLASILASVSSLRDFGDRFEPAVREDLLATIQEEAERLNAFVANLLNMTRLEGGGLVVRSEPFEIDSVLQRTIARHERRRGTRTLRQILGAPGAMALGDPILLEQALGNVVENAIRFSPEGGAISLDIRSGADTIEITVEDEGPGVPPEDLDRVFDKFFRSASAAVTLQGTGLGLSITKGLVEAMGGTVLARARAQPPGLSVCLTLPRAAP